jgi:hypothetical protein
VNDGLWMFGIKVKYIEEGYTLCMFYEHWHELRCHVRPRVGSELILSEFTLFGIDLVH